MPNISLRNAQDMPKICSRNAQVMLKICLKYVRNVSDRSQMSQECPRYVPDMASICLLYRFQKCLLSAFQLTKQTANQQLRYRVSPDFVNLLIDKEILANLEFGNWKYLTSQDPWEVGCMFRFSLLWRSVSGVISVD